MIINGINSKIVKQEKLRDTYINEMTKIEKKIAKLSSKETVENLEAELRLLEAEEQELDQ
jgi:hypothetical protein